MADYAFLRKSRNALSTFTHILLNVIFAIVATALTIIGKNWIFGALVVLLSKWRVFAVRSRYWGLNLRANIVDFVVGVSFTMLVYAAGVEMLNPVHVILTLAYIVWLLIVKPLSSEFGNELQAFCAVFFGSLATALITDKLGLNPVFVALLSFIIGYGACRHILTQNDDQDFSFTAFLIGLVFTEIAWLLYHWVIVYPISFGSTVLEIPQLPIVTTALFFTFIRGYKSALRHDGKIRADDIVLPAVFSASLILVMILLFSVAKFNV